jgi:hypothetical protein
MNIIEEMAIDIQKTHPELTFEQCYDIAFDRLHEFRNDLNELKDLQYEPD